MPLTRKRLLDLGCISLVKSEGQIPPKGSLPCKDSCTQSIQLKCPGPFLSAAFVQGFWNRRVQFSSLMRSESIILSEPYIANSLSSFGGVEPFCIQNFAAQRPFATLILAPLRRRPWIDRDWLNPNPCQQVLQVVAMNFELCRSECIQVCRATPEMGREHPAHLRCPTLVRRRHTAPLGCIHAGL